jgi:heme exporter protein B
MIRAAKQSLLIAAKDLRIESRSRQTISLVVVLGILVVTVLGLGLGGQRPGGPAATAVLWVAYLFSGVLCFEKTMAVERQDGALAGLLLAPLDRGVIYLGKLLSNVVLMFAVAGVITPVGILFFGFDLSKAPLGFFAIMGMSMLGFAAVGTLFAAMVSSSRLQGGLLAMVVFPITLPLVIASTQLTSRLYQDGETWNGSAFAVLIAFDAIFLVVSWLAFEWVIEP